MACARPPAARPGPGVHIIVAAIHLPARGKQPPAGGWAIEAHDVADDEQRTQTLRLSAHGAVPACSTHGTGAPPHAPQPHTVQPTHHTALAATPHYAPQCAQRKQRQPTAQPEQTEQSEQRLRFAIAAVCSRLYGP